MTIDFGPVHGPHHTCARHDVNDVKMMWCTLTSKLLVSEVNTMEEVYRKVLGNRKAGVVYSRITFDLNRFKCLVNFRKLRNNPYPSCTTHTHTHTPTNRHTHTHRHTIKIGRIPVFCHSGWLVGLLVSSMKSYTLIIKFSDQVPLPALAIFRT